MLLWMQGEGPAQILCNAFGRCVLTSVPKHKPRKTHTSQYSLMSNKSFWGLSLAAAAAMPFVTFSASAWRAASTWASICWVFTYAGISPVFGAWPLLSGRVLMSNDPAVDNQKKQLTAAVWIWFILQNVVFVSGSMSGLTLLYEYGPSVVSPVFSTVASLVICLIYRTCACLITHRHTVISYVPQFKSFRSGSEG